MILERLFMAQHRSEKHKKIFDLIAVILIVALNIGWVQIPGRPTVISVILVLPLVLYLPGYALTQVLFYKNDEPDQTRPRAEAAHIGARLANTLKQGHPIGGTDQLVLSLGLSMAIDILVGIGLTLLPIGLQPLSWTLALGLFAVLCASLALLLRRKHYVAAKTARPSIAVLDILFLILGALIIGNSIWLAVIRPAQAQSSFTEFWMLPADQANKTCAVSLGVQSFESSSTMYTIIMTVNNTQATSNISPLVLEPQQKWVQTLPITPVGQNDLHIEAQLYRTTQPSTVYRDVHLTFHVTMVSQNGQAQAQCTLGT